MSDLIKAVEAAAAEALAPLGFRKRWGFFVIEVVPGVRGMVGLLRDARGGALRITPALHIHDEQLERLRAELWWQKRYDRSSLSIHIDRVNPDRPTYLFQTTAEAPRVMAELAADVKRLGLPWLARGSTLEGLLGLFEVHRRDLAGIGMICLLLGRREAGLEAIATKKAEVEAKRDDPSADEWTVNTANTTLERLGRIEARLLTLPASQPSPDLKSKACTQVAAR
jgi:hypothetical protein